MQHGMSFVPLSGQSYRLWIQVQYTTDKVEYFDEVAGYTLTVNFLLTASAELETPETLGLLFGTGWTHLFYKWEIPAPRTSYVARMHVMDIWANEVPTLMDALRDLPAIPNTIDWTKMAMEHLRALYPGVIPSVGPSFLAEIELAGRVGLVQREYVEKQDRDIVSLFSHRSYSYLGIELTPPPPSSFRKTFMKSKCAIPFLSTNTVYSKASRHRHPYPSRRTS